MYCCDLEEDNEACEESDSIWYRNEESDHRFRERSLAAVVTLLRLGLEAEVHHYECWVDEVNGKDNETDLESEVKGVSDVMIRFRHAGLVLGE